MSYFLLVPYGGFHHGVALWPMYSRKNASLCGVCVLCLRECV